MHSLNTLKHLHDAREADRILSKDHTEADTLTEKRMAEAIEEASKRLAATRGK